MLSEPVIGCPRNAHAPNIPRTGWKCAPIRPPESLRRSRPARLQRLHPAPVQAREKGFELRPVQRNEASLIAGQVCIAQVWRSTCGVMGLSRKEGWRRDPGEDAHGGRRRGVGQEGS